MNKHEQPWILSYWNKHESCKYKNVVASLEGFILFLKLEYFFSTGFFFVLIYDKQVLMCITII